MRRSHYRLFASANRRQHAAFVHRRAAAAVAGEASSASCCSLTAVVAPAAIFHQRRGQAWCAEPPTARWMCPQCLAVNGITGPSAATCGSCRAPRGAAAAGENERATRGVLETTWTCGNCGRAGMPGTVKFCRACAAPYRPPPAWTCPACGGANAIDPASRTAPPRCGHCPFTVRPTAADAAAAATTRAARSEARPEGSDDAAAAAGGGEQDGDVSGSESLSTAAVAPTPTTPMRTPPAVSIPIPSPPLPGARRAAPANAAVPGHSTPAPSPPVSQDIPAEEVRKLGPPGFPWLCRDPACATLNDGTSLDCRGCGALMRPGVRWFCDCGATNHVTRTQCFGCAAPIQPSWLCLACRARGSVYDVVCGKCHEPRRAAGAAGSSSLSSRARHGPEWLCHICHKSNRANRTACIGCETPRLSDEEANGGAGAGVMAPVGDSNWSCQRCRASNFRTRRVCWQCELPIAAGAQAPGAGIDDAENVRPAIAQEGFQEAAAGDAGAEKKKEKRVWLTPEDKMDDQDWVCARCMHKNFRNQKDCFRCFAPKAVAPVSRVVVKPKTKNFNCDTRDTTAVPVPQAGTSYSGATRTERAIAACDDRIARVRGVMYTSAFSEAMQECTAAFHDAERALQQLMECLEETTNDASVIDEISPGGDGDDLRSLKGETASSEDSHHLSEPSSSTLADRLRRRVSRWPGKEQPALRELTAAWAAMEERWYDLVVDTSIM